MNDTSFDKQFEQLTGHKPFPWQRLLCSRLLSDPQPIGLDMPTGCGKTEVIAIWLLARADRPWIPRRLVYVNSRDCIIDHASQVARNIRANLSSPDCKSLREGIGLTSPKLPMSTAWGTHAGDPEWLQNPTSPGVIVGSIDTIGSALLFEAYGVPRTHRPWVAGLLACDTLFVLDDSRLSEPFEALLEAAHVEQRRETHPRDGGAPRSRLITLSTAPSRTVPKSDGEQKLSACDRKDVTLRKRLLADKTLTIQEPKSKTPLHTRLAEEAWSLGQTTNRYTKHGTRTLVYCDSQSTADKVAAELRKRTAKTKSRHLILTIPDGIRCHERTQLAGELNKLGLLTQSTSSTKRPVFVVATRPGEAGIDMTADHMVCDVVGWERMVLRLGRVNRLGESAATVVVVDQGPPAGKDPGGQNDKRRLAVLRTLQMLPNGKAGRQAGPQALEQLAETAHGRDAISKASTPPPLHPPFTRALLDTWSMTSLTEHTGRPAVEPWLHGWHGEEPTSRIIWRDHPGTTPATGNGYGAEQRDGHNSRPVVLARAPAPTEVLETTSAQLSAWLKKRTDAIAQQQNDQQNTRRAHAKAGNRNRSGRKKTRSMNRIDLKKPVALVLRPDNTVTRSFTLQGLQNVKNWKGITALLSGRLLVVDSRMGGLQNGRLDGRSDEAATVVRNRNNWTVPAEESCPPAVHTLNGHQHCSRAQAERMTEKLGLNEEHRRKIVEANGPIEDLALHLTAARNGFARPNLHTAGRQNLPPSQLAAVAAQAAHRFARLQQQLGPWGLAWLEALLRAAQWQTTEQLHAKAEPAGNEPGNGIEPDNQTGNAS